MPTPYGRLVDQAMLLGVLNGLHDSLHMLLLSVECLSLDAREDPSLEAREDPSLEDEIVGLVTGAGHAGAGEENRREDRSPPESRAQMPLRCPRGPGGAAIQTFSLISFACVKSSR